MAVVSKSVSCSEIDCNVGARRLRALSPSLWCSGGPHQSSGSFGIWHRAAGRFRRDGQSQRRERSSDGQISSSSKCLFLELLQTRSSLSAQLSRGVGAFTRFLPSNNDPARESEPEITPARMQAFFTDLFAESLLNLGAQTDAVLRGDPLADGGFMSYARTGMFSELGAPSVSMV